MKRRANQCGFTLVELMIATSVFAVVLLGAAAALIQITKLYYKGVISSRTQGVSRTTIDEISRAIQFSGEQVVNVGPEVKGMSPNNIEVRSVCIGTARYTYAINAQVDDTVTSYATSDHKIPHALWKDTVTSPSECDPDVDANDNLPDLTSSTLSSTNDGREILEQGMRLSQFGVSTIGDDNLYKVDVGVIFGDDVLLLPDANNPTTCVGSILGGQWCAVSVLSTQVFKRIQ